MRKLLFAVLLLGSQVQAQTTGFGTPVCFGVSCGSSSGGGSSSSGDGVTVSASSPFSALSSSVTLQGNLTNAANGILILNASGQITSAQQANWSLQYSTVVPANISTVTISGISTTTHGTYWLVINSTGSATGNQLYCYLNDDLTNSDYYSSRQENYLAAATVGARTGPEAMPTGISGFIYIQNTQGYYPTEWSYDSYYNATANVWDQHSNTLKAALQHDVTRIDLISASTLDIKAGTAINLYSEH